MTDLEHVGTLLSDDIPEDSLLGYLIGIVHHKFTMYHKEMDRILEETELPDEYWPHKPKPVPSFQAACRSLESPKFEEIIFRDPGSGMDIKFGVEYMIDTLKDGSRQLTRKISFIGNENASKEVEKILDIYVNTTQKEPEKMAKFEYDAKSDSVKRTNLYDNPASLAIGEMTDKKYAKAVAQFNLIKKCYTERYLKDAWFRMLRAEGGIPWLKNCGSLWFAPKTAKKCVESFGKLYGAIHKDGGTWRAIPIIDTKQHRKYLAEDVQAEFNDRFKLFLENIAKKMESGMGEDKLQQLASKNKDTFESGLNKELVQRYNNLLGMSISAKVSDIQIDFDSSRLMKAKQFLANL